MDTFTISHAREELDAEFADIVSLFDKSNKELTNR
ncbi:Prevent host death protein (fragment) [Xenorhabdus innexi]|uniref:Prevent host death protein n=1 Tax=Xenorhabdus innexi TaxID=290109 RepID=A0A1N6MSV7_9GAMM